MIFYDISLKVGNLYRFSCVHIKNALILILRRIKKIASINSFRVRPVLETAASIIFFLQTMRPQLESDF